jgi:putative DNA primase/helicase
MFGAWTTWCGSQGRDHSGTKESFGRDLRAAVPRVKKVRHTEGGGRDFYYEGVALKPT